MAILKIRDENGNIQEITVIKGDKGDPGKDAEGAVLYTPQILSQEKQAQARANIGLTVFGVPYASAEQTFDLNATKTVKMHLFPTAEGYDAVVTGSGAIADSAVSYTSYLPTENTFGKNSETIITYDNSYKKKDSRPHKDYVDKINRLHIEKGVTSIGKYFMYEAYHLRKLTFEDSKTIRHLGAYAFSQTLIDGEYDFSGLTDTEIDQVFSYCKKMQGVTLSNAVRNIKKWSFEKCTSLRYVHGLSGVTSIGDAAFQYCTSLEDIDVDPNKAILDRWVFILTPPNVVFTGTKNLLASAVWTYREGKKNTEGEYIEVVDKNGRIKHPNCFIPNLWTSGELDDIRKIGKVAEGEPSIQIQFSIPESDNQNKTMYKNWLLYPQTDDDQYLGYWAPASGNCILFTLFHIYNASHPNAQYDTYYDFIKREIQPKKFMVTQELHDTLYADAWGRILLENTNGKYNVGNEICATDLMYSTKSGGNVGMGAAYWGICHALGWTIETVEYAPENWQDKTGSKSEPSEGAKKGAEAKRLLIDALLSGKLVTFSIVARSDSAGHAVTVIGYDGKSDRFLVIDSTGPFPADIDKLVYWCAFESMTSIYNPPKFYIIDFNNSSSGIPAYNGEILVSLNSNVQYYNKEVEYL